MATIGAVSSSAAFPSESLSQSSELLIVGRGCHFHVNATVMICLFLKGSFVFWCFIFLHAPQKLPIGMNGLYEEEVHFSFTATDIYGCYVS